MSAKAQLSESVPPQPEKKPVRLKKHGDIRIDDYFWLKERENPAVLKYLKEENAYTEEKLKPVEKLTDTLVNEMRARIIDDESTPPYRRGEYYYNIRYDKGAEYPIFARRKNKITAPEEIILNVNELAKGHDYYDCGNVKVSPDQQIIAYAVDTVGRRFYDIYFKNLKTGKLLGEKIEKTTGSIVWTNDNNTYFYSTQDPDTLRSNKIFRKALGEPAVLIYEEKDPLYYVDVSKSLNQQTLFMYVSGMTASEVWTLDANEPMGQFSLLQKREAKHEYSVEDGGDRYFIVTNWKAKNFRLMEVDKKKSGKKHWREILGNRQSVLLEDITVFQNYLIFEERENGLTKIRYQNRKTKKTSTLPFQDPAYIASVGTNAEYETTILRYEYESMVHPNTIFDLNLETGESVVVKAKIVPTYNPEHYNSERLWATAHDGKKIPVSIVYRKDKFKPGANPILVYGYGSYGSSTDPGFFESFVSLLDRGFVFALAHVRGGSEMGRDWYETGKFLKKKNTFKDFISVTEFLLKKKFAAKNHIYAMGGSAGGLLMGAIVNMRPDLYNGIVAQVPFVDVITTMLDDSIPLTTVEYEEWGNPNKKDYYKYMKSYSPYDNVTNQKYPNILVTSGFHDSQVQYWEPTKWVAKLRDHNTNKSLILLKTELEAGHSGTTGRYNSLKESAVEYAFLLMLENQYK